MSDPSAVGAMPCIARPLLLRPLVAPELSRFLGESKLPFTLVDGLGSPLNLLFPERLPANLGAFKQVLAAHNVSGKVFFAHKSNQSDCLIRRLALEDVCADVASLEELRHALGSGFTGARLEATGPKSLEFLALCVQHDVIINVDSLQELADIQAVRKTLGSKKWARVLLRLCGFKAEHTPVLTKQSRFGIAVGQLTEALAKVQSDGGLVLAGFAFHLDSVSVSERVVAIENCIAAIDAAIELGMQPSILNVGGGFRVNYLAHEEDWHNYTAAIKQAALGAGVAVAWQGNLFGLAAEGGTLRGRLNSYNYFEASPGAAFLNDILAAQLPAYENKTVATFLQENMIELWLEPGRSLLDQAGITLARVASSKRSSHGDILVGLAMKRQDLAFLDQEVFVDPVLIKRRPVAPAACPPAYTPVYFTGHLCLESDLIFRHQVFVPSLPEPGDVLAFINTAAYMMDFSSTHSIMQPPARRVAVVSDGNDFNWILDSEYSPVWRLLR